ANLHLRAIRSLETLLQSRESAGRRIRVKRPSLGSILLGLVPFAATCFSVALWDRVYPTVLGLPFNVFWLILWLLLTPACMCWAYWLEISPPRNTDQGKGNTHLTRAPLR